jgi:hypothetical protein
MLAVSNIAELVRRSNLLGSDRTIANQGGGNTSMKGRTIDHAGREVSVVWVKASGADLASIKEPGFPALGSSPFASGRPGQGASERCRSGVGADWRWGRREVCECVYPMSTGFPVTHAIRTQGGRDDPKQR